MFFRATCLFFRLLFVPSVCLNQQHSAVQDSRCNSHLLLACSGASPRVLLLAFHLRDMGSPSCVFMLMVHSFLERVLCDIPSILLFLVETPNDRSLCTVSHQVLQQTAHWVFSFAFACPCLIHEAIARFRDRRANRVMLGIPGGYSVVAVAGVE